LPVPEDLLRLADEKGWPLELLQRAADLRVPRSEIERWLAWDQPRTQEMFARWVSQWDRLTSGTLRAREAAGLDSDAFADLWANSPEEIGTAGELEVTVERSPDAFAQFRLQENVTISVLEDRGLLLASIAWSRRNAIVGGKRLSVLFSQALRVRKEFRREGYGNMVRGVPLPAVWQGHAHGFYGYFRSQNFGVYNFTQATTPGGWFRSAPEREGDLPGISVSVLQYPARPLTGDPTGIRKARRSDTRRCVALINRTHRGLDLFRPYTAEFLQHRLDEGYWGARAAPRQQPTVYSWQEYYVLEEGGRIVAGAGLWDRGRDVRERWRDKSTGEERVLTATALMDFGYEAGHEESMARLIAYLIGETERLGRGYLLAPLQYQPSLAALLAEYAPTEEIRALDWNVYGQEQPDPPVIRPYTDLSYW